MPQGQRSGEVGGREAGDHPVVQAQAEGLGVRVAEPVAGELFDDRAGHVRVGVVLEKELERHFTGA